MNTRKVLVFPCGSEIALEVHRALCYAKEVDLWGAGSRPDHGELTYANYIAGVPFYDDPDFLDKLNDVIQNYGFDYVIPAYDPVIRILSEAAEAGKLRCKLLGARAECVRICSSKRTTHVQLSGAVPLPHLYRTLNDVAHYPVFLKPEFGSGSKGAVKADTREEAEFYLARDRSLLIFEYLPGTEYTVDCYTSAQGELLFCGARERARIMNGIAVRTFPVSDGRLEEMANAINERIPFNGVWFFQVKTDAGGELQLMEVGPRIAGAMGLHRAMGVNFPLMMLYEAEGYEVAKPLLNNYPIIADRALAARFNLELDYNVVYVDLDDCLIIRGQVNTQLVQFLYQCINEGKRLVLLTRHAIDPHQTLQQYRLQQTFNEVIHITDPAMHKSDYITRKDAIFIDDSFGERAEVAQRCGIPVFAPDMVEALLHS